MDIPDHLRISTADLDSFLQHSHCPVHFTTKLPERLFPELFTSANSRLQYSYHGGGKRNKFEMSQERKSALQRYTLHYYPHLSDARAWKDAIVPRVNEYLRRLPKNQ